MADLISYGPRRAPGERVKDDEDYTAARTPGDPVGAQSLRRRWHSPTPTSGRRAVWLPQLGRAPLGGLDIHPDVRRKAETNRAVRHLDAGVECAFPEKGPHPAEHRVSVTSTSRGGEITPDHIDQIGHGTVEVGGQTGEHQPVLAAGEIPLVEDQLFD